MKSCIKYFILCFIFLLPSPGGALADTSATVIPDDPIAFWVRDALREDPRVDASSVKVFADKGIVTLSGDVRNLLAKKYATLEAKKIQGVRGVINEIDVKPKPRLDADIRQDILRRFLTSSDINTLHIGVQVNNGRVALTGTVNSWSKSREIELLAEEVPGVNSVTNDLTVEDASKRPDTDIRQDIIAKIDRDVYLNGLPITTQVTDGVATLSGTVGSLYQKERAWKDAFSVVNVHFVKNNLTVEYWENDGVRKKSTPLSDLQIKQAVSDELKQDLRIVNAYGITVEVSHGWATLRGIVPSLYQKRVADQDARNVVGVRSVNNRLSVNAEFRDDASVLSDAQFQIASDEILSGLGIQIGVKDGVATLRGDVNAIYEKMHAEEVVSRVLGVRNVINHITVHWNQQHSDAALKVRIQDRLAQNWQTRPVKNRILVNVNKGRVTLKGDVDTWSEYEEATQTASYLEGVRSVDNQLEVTGTVQ